MHKMEFALVQISLFKLLMTMFRSQMEVESHDLSAERLRPPRRLCPEIRKSGPRSSATSCFGLMCFLSPCLPLSLLSLSFLSSTLLTDDSPPSSSSLLILIRPPSVRLGFMQLRLIPLSFFFLHPSIPCLLLPLYCSSSCSPSAFSCSSLIFLFDLFLLSPAPARISFSPPPSTASHPKLSSSSSVVLCHQQSSL